MNKFRLYRDGLGTLVGMIFGAGVFALPYSFAKAGVIWGFFHFAVAMFFMLVLHLMYGEVAYLTEGQHRFTGYVRKFLGRKAEFLAFFTTVLSYYGALLVYGILGGIFMSTFADTLSVFQYTLIFFALGALFALFNFEKIGALNFYLTIPIFLFIFYLFGLSLPEIRLEHFLAGSSESWFLPYGIWLFALGGFSSLPEARDIMRGASLKDFKNVIIWSLVASAAVYFLFIITVLGVSGSLTTEDALSGLSGPLGSSAIVIGSLIGFIAVFTSFIAIAADLKNIFVFDYGFQEWAGWVFTILPAPIIFLLGLNQLVSILGFVGAVGLGVLGIFVIEMARRLHKVFPGHEHNFLGPKPWVRWVLILGLLAGVFLEVRNLF